MAGLLLLLLILPLLQLLLLYLLLLILPMLLILLQLLLNLLLLLLQQLLLLLNLLLLLEPGSRPASDSCCGCVGDRDRQCRDTHHHLLHNFSTTGDTCLTNIIGPNMPRP